jgi:hypothetical protein
MPTTYALRAGTTAAYGTDRGDREGPRIDATTVIAARLGRRGGHFVSATLLGSQLETLEPLGPDEDGVVVDVDDSPDVLAGHALAALDLSNQTGSESLCLR